MTSEKVLVTAIVPCYNGSKYLPQMLDCFLKQTYSHWEAIFVDDQSVDNSVEILKDYHEKDGRIKYLIRNRLPKGAQTCRNMGFEYAKGSKYVCFFDCDDIIAPFCLEQRVAFMESHPQIDFAVFPAKTFKTNPNEQSWRYYGIMSQPDEYLNFLFPWLSFVVWCNIYKYDSLVSHHISWDEKILVNQDSDFNIQALHSGMSFCYAEEFAAIDYFYRKTGNISVSSLKRDVSRFHSHLYLIDKFNKTFTCEEKKRYRKAISHRLLFYASFFYKDKPSLITLINHPFFNAGWWLKLRLRFIAPYLHHKKIAAVFFPILKKKFRDFKQDYSENCAEKIKKMETSIKLRGQNIT